MPWNFQSSFVFFPPYIYFFSSLLLLISFLNSTSRPLFFSFRYIYTTFTYLFSFLISPSHFMISSFSTLLSTPTRHVSLLVRRWIENMVTWIRNKRLQLLNPVILLSPQHNERTDFAHGHTPRRMQWNFIHLQVDGESKLNIPPRANGVLRITPQSSDSQGMKIRGMVVAAWIHARASQGEGSGDTGLLDNDDWMPDLKILVSWSCLHWKWLN